MARSHSCRLGGEQRCPCLLYTSLLAPERLNLMPTTPENIANQVAIDVTSWADYGEQLEQRFNAWAARQEPCLLYTSRCV